MNYPFAVELKSAADYLTITAPLFFQDDLEAVDLFNRLATKLHDLAVIEAGDKARVLYGDNRYNIENPIMGADMYGGGD